MRRSAMLRAALTGLGLGAAWGVAARVWMRLVTDTPEFSWVGTAFIVGLSAWFGLFVTGLNLVPVGQLDGGHAVYALFGARAFVIARAAWWTCVGLIALAGPSWILWVILVRLIGIRHPPTLDDSAGLGRGRVLVGVLCLAIFVVTFLYQPVPFSWLDVWRQIRG